MEYVEARLAEWGRWCCRHESGTIGYPRRTVLGRFRADGGILLRGQGASVVPLDSNAEQMERIVARLWLVRQEWAEVLRWRYVEDLAERQIAKDMGASRSAVRVMLSAATAWVGGKLDQA